MLKRETIKRLKSLDISLAETYQKASSLPHLLYLYGKLSPMLIKLYGIAHFEAFKGVVKSIYKHLSLIKERKLQAIKGGDVFLIAYPDHIKKKGHTPLESLYEFMNREDIFSGIHILPFFTSDFDEGYAVSDYRSVKNSHGTWDDVFKITNKYKTIYDFVLNHTSTSHTWFRRFIKDDPEYRGFYILKGPYDWSKTFRPRETPLFHEFNGKLVLTTFSKKHVDLNYKNPKVLEKMVDIALYYLSTGAIGLRLDAIPYIWKDPSTTSYSIPQTFTFLKLLNAITKIVDKNTYLLSEVNGFHKEICKYLNQGSDLVYNLGITIMALDALYHESTDKLSLWIKDLSNHVGEGTFFNSAATHDGIAVLPGMDVLGEERINEIVRHIQDQGGLLSYRNTPNGKKVYEINSTIYSLFENEDKESRMKKFLLIHALSFALPGVPAIYLQSYLAAPNDMERLKKTKYNRSVNRHRFTWRELESLPKERKELSKKIKELIRWEKELIKEDPFQKVKVRDFGGVLVVEKKRTVYVLNFTSKRRVLEIKGFELPSAEMTDIVELEPYSFSIVKKTSKSPLDLVKNQAFNPL